MELLQEIQALPFSDRHQVDSETLFQTQVEYETDNVKQFNLQHFFVLYCYEINVTGSFPSC